MHFFNEVNLVFDQFMPVVMCCMVAGIHVGGTYVLGAICFFCYLFFNLVFNYAKLYDKLERK
jgi:1,4-dihydroxy-2-naphthoyl-CoA synthase